ncbi:MAG: glycerol-3-phosphate dehydrogenase, partial [Leptospiraceae bacterium]|nr:glycerol-3-phosphate dehydrogenase [Leptospiraceae bacterium]
FGLAKLSIDDVDYFYGGLRPLVEDPGEKSDTYNASRKSEILDHKEKGLPGFFSALGGKYTTSRAVAENLVNHLTKYLGNTNVSCTTDRTPLISGRYNTLKELVDDLQKKFPEIEGEKLETIAKRYGSQAEKILKNSRRNVYSLANYEKIYEEEIEYICSNEDIVTARDFYLRRSGVGIPGLPVEEEHKKIMQKLATILSWDKAGLEEEDRVLRACYIPKET